MANWDDLKQTFFEETEEGLEAIDAGLTDIRDGAESDDTVNAVFRAIHSAKGGAGVFGFEALVRFAHVFETVLDAVRHGTLSPRSRYSRCAVHGERRAGGFCRHGARPTSRCRPDTATNAGRRSRP